MGKHVLVLGLAFAVLAAFAVAAGWIFFAASEPTPSGWSLGRLEPYILGGGALLIALVGFVAWLAHYRYTHPDDAGR